MQIGINAEFAGWFCVRDRIVLLATASAARASEFSDDLAARRARVMDRLGPEAMLILWSAPTARYSNDVDYKYRQDSNLYYLTGVTQPDTMLILMPGNETRREILFVKDRNPAQEHWTGPLLSTEEARARTGIETVLPSTPVRAVRDGDAQQPRVRGGRREAGRALLRCALGWTGPAWGSCSIRTAASTIR